MNILYIDHYAGSDDMGMEFRPFYLAKEWQKNGHRTVIVAGSYSHLRKKNPSIQKDFSIENHEGIPYCWVKTRRYRGNGMTRVFSMMEFTGKLYVNAAKIARRFKPDLVICSSTYPIDTYAGQRIAKLCGAKLIHEIHDLWPLTPMVLGGYDKKHPFIQLLKKAEDSAYKNSDVIVSILPNAVQYVREQKIQTPVVHIPNGIRLEKEFLEKPNADIANLVRDCKTAGFFVIGYAGGMALSNAMKDFLEALNQLKDKKIFAVLIGDGVERKNLEAYAKQNRLKNIAFCKPISKQQVIPTLQKMDGLFAGGHKSILYQYGLALNKLFDYMLTGKPIIIALGSKYSPLNECGTGIVCESENVESIAKGIQEAMSLSNTEKEGIAEKQIAHVKNHYTYQHIGKQFEQVFVNLKEGREVVHANTID